MGPGPASQAWPTELRHVKVKPALWGLHTYQEVTASHGEPTQSADFLENLATAHMGHPKLWITEAGVVLKLGATKTSAFGHPDRQVSAARRFLGLGLSSAATRKQVAIVFYYLLSAGEKTEFDSALLNPNKGHAKTKPKLRRPADCVIEQVKNSRRCPVVTY